MVLKPDRATETVEPNDDARNASVSLGVTDEEDIPLDLLKRHLGEFGLDVDAALHDDVEVEYEEENPDDPGKERAVLARKIKLTNIGLPAPDVPRLLSESPKKNGFWRKRSKSIFHAVHRQRVVETLAALQEQQANEDEADSDDSSTAPTADSPTNKSSKEECGGCKHVQAGHFCPFCGKRSEQPFGSPSQRTGGRTKHIHVQQSPMKSLRPLQQMLKGGKTALSQRKMKKSEKRHLAVFIIQCWARRMRRKRREREAKKNAMPRRYTLLVPDGEDLFGNKPQKQLSVELTQAEKLAALLATSNASLPKRSTSTATLYSTTTTTPNTTTPLPENYGDGAKHGNHNNKRVWRHIGEKYDPNKQHNLTKLNNGSTTIPSAVDGSSLTDLPIIKDEDKHGHLLRDYLQELKSVAEEATVLYNISAPVIDPQHYTNLMKHKQPTSSAAAAGGDAANTPTTTGCTEECFAANTPTTTTEREGLEVTTVAAGAGTTQCGGVSPSPSSVSKKSVLGSISIAGQWIGAASQSLFVDEPLMRLCNLPCRTPYPSPRASGNSAALRCHQAESVPLLSSFPSNRKHLLPPGMHNVNMIKSQQQQEPLPPLTHHLKAKGQLGQLKAPPKRRTMPPSDVVHKGSSGYKKAPQRHQHTRLNSSNNLKSKIVARDGLKPMLVPHHHYHPHPLAMVSIDALYAQTVHNKVMT